MKAVACAESGSHYVSEMGREWQLLSFGEGGYKEGTNEANAFQRKWRTLKKSREHQWVLSL